MMNLHGRLAEALATISGDQGADLSHYQVVNDWKAFSSSKKFVYIKATEGSAAGSAYVDPSMDSHFNGAKSVGIDRGFYHFARYVSVADAQAEADWFIAHIKNYDFTLPPCLDLEFNGCGSTAVLEQATQAFLAKVEAALGSCIIYCSAEYFGWVKDVVQGKYGIWLADPSSQINIPLTQAQLFGWQYNWHGSVPGVASEVDLDVACGSFYTTHNKALAVAPSPVPAPVYVAPVHEVAPTPVAAAPVAPAPAPVAPATYTVHAGDTLSAIAAKFGLTTAELESWNHIANANLIQVGQVLQLHAPAPAPAPKPVYVPTYTVHAGDTLSAIAAKFGVSEQKIMSLNGISNPNLIYVGQVLKFEASAPAAPATLNYVVKSGDTLSQIAASHSTTTSELQRLNGISNPNAIYIGQVLHLPASGSAPAPAAPAPVAEYYTVKAGDTLSGIAAKEGVSQRTLEKLNGITNPNLIRIGQHLRYR